MYVLGALSLAQREKRWIASCGEHRGGRAGKLEQQNAGRTRNLRVLFFLSFCRSHAVSGPGEKRLWTAGQIARKKEPSVHMVRKAHENRGKLDKKLTGNR